MVSDQMHEKEKNNQMMVEVLSQIMEFRNGESGLHVVHINTLTRLFLERLVENTDAYNLTPDDCYLISTASAFHDIGKVGIDESILNKPGKLTKEEFETMKEHTLIGASMLDKLEHYKDEKMIKIAYQICRWHHERYDGRGYPDGLKGDEIPISAQVVALADVYDALTSKRCYKNAYDHETAMNMIMSGECGAFNPLLLKCLYEISPKLRMVVEEDMGEETYRQEADRLAADVMKKKSMPYSDRAQRMLESMQERLEFFSSLNGGIQFEASSIYYDLGFLRAYDSYIFNYKDGNYDVADIGLGNEGAVEAYTFLQKLATEYKFVTSDITSDTAKSNFQNGNTAFYIGGPWDIEGLNSAGTPFAVAPMPKLNGKDFVTPVGTQVGFVSAKSDSQDIVWEFYQYLLENSEEDMYKAGGRIPAQLAAQESIEKDAATESFITQISYGEPMPTASEMGQVWTPFSDNMKLMFNGEVTPKEAGNYIETQVAEGIEMMNSGK